MSLTGHISTVRGLAVSNRHPYLFSCAEDKVRFRTVLTLAVRWRAEAPPAHRWSNVGTSRRTRSSDTITVTCQVSTHYRECLSGTSRLFGFAHDALKSALHSLHPTLDVLVTAGRDASARVWDMRTKAQVHVLAGHTGTVSTVQCQESDPQVITGSMDSTVR